MAKNMARIENGVVVNIEWVSDKIQETDFFKNIGDRPVEINDTFDGEFFYRNGEKVLTALETLQTNNTEYVTALQMLGVEV